MLLHAVVVVESGDDTVGVGGAFCDKPLPPRLVVCGDGADDLHEDVVALLVVEQTARLEAGGASDGGADGLPVTVAPLRDAVAMEPGFAESHQRVSESGCQFSLSAWFKTGTSSSSAGVKSVRERTAVSAT